MSSEFLIYRIYLNVILKHIADNDSVIDQYTFFPLYLILDLSRCDADEYSFHTDIPNKFFFLVVRVMIDFNGHNLL